VILELLSHTLKKNLTQLGMGNRTTAEENRQLHLIASIQKSCGMITLGLQIVSANLGLDPDLLELGDLLILLGITLFPALFVPVLPVIHQATNGRRRVRRDFHEVKTSLASHLQRIPCWDNADLAAFIIDESHFPDSDSLVYARLCWSGNSWPPEFTGPVRGA
jgi:hypothetical protein